MTNMEVVQLDVQLETTNMESEIVEIKNLLADLTNAATKTGMAINRALNPDNSSLSDVHKTFQNMADDLDLAATKMAELVTLMEPQGESWCESAIAGVDGFNTLADGLKNVNDLSESISKGLDKAEKNGESFNVFKALVPELSGLFGKMTTKIKDGTAAMWLQNAATTAWQGISTAATAVTTAFGAAVNFLTSPIGLVVLAIAALIAIIVLLVANWDTVKEALLAAWEAVKNAVAVAVDWISTKVQEGMAFVQNIFAGISEFMQGIFAKDWTEQFGAFGNVLNAFFANVENVWNAVKSIFGGIVDFVKNVFAGDWGAAWDSVVGIFKGIWDLLVSIVKAPINIVIGLINGLVQGVVDGINLVINALNGLSFDIPDWVPILGGQKFGFNLTPLVAPKIPLLAKGAVLPANKPFLAMVGDQRHGTNVEAPLATIQEAVALVMEDQFNGMMAGFEAVTARQEQILETLLGIEIGDTTIGQAAARYNRKMAIIKGGI